MRAEIEMPYESHCASMQVGGTHPLRRAEQAQSCRAGLIALVTATPGIALADAARSIGLRLSTARYHIDRLEADGRVISHTIGGRRLLFPSEWRSLVGNGASILLLDRTARRLALAIGGSAIPSVLERPPAGVSRRAAYHHLKRFKEAGMIDCPDPRSYRRCRPSAQLQRIIETLMLAEANSASSAASVEPAGGPSRPQGPRLA